ncbi:MAG: hypothetical protein HOV87_12095 [Catenulispora sp.]|nr:hypothetical protein [Catenulispora sp.]NUT40009.1 hypothetical protein [Thermoactinospora sp.]
MKIRTRLAAAAAAALIAILGTPPPPAAASGSSGTTAVNIGGNSARVAWAGWAASDDHMWVDVHLSTTLASGYCADSWFDWTTPEGSSHFDGRGSRTCRSNTTIYGPVLYESYNMASMQKDGGMYGPDNNTKSYQYTDAPGSDISVNTINPNFNTSTNCSIRWWKINSAGQWSEFSGGSPTSATC